MNALSLFAVLTAALLGSPHCAGMCGGFVLFYATKAPAPWKSHAAYNIGRLTTYTALGAICGYFGRLLNSTASYAGLQQASALLCGLLLIAWGIRGLLHTSQPLPSGGTPSSSVVSKLVARLRLLLLSSSLSWPQRSFLVGALSTFLPCGFLYTFLLLAAAGASPALGAATMLFFWVGTLPVMLSLAGVVCALSSTLRSYVPRFTAALVLAAGLYSLSLHAQPLMSLLPYPLKCHHCH